MLEGPEKLRVVSLCLILNQAEEAIKTKAEKQFSVVSTSVPSVSRPYPGFPQWRTVTCKLLYILKRLWTSLWYCLLSMFYHSNRKRRKKEFGTISKYCCECWTRPCCLFRKLVEEFWSLSRKSHWAWCSKLKELWWEVGAQKLWEKYRQWNHNLWSFKRKYWLWLNQESLCGI